MELEKEIFDKIQENVALANSGSLKSDRALERIQELLDWYEQRKEREKPSSSVKP